MHCSIIGSSIITTATIKYGITRAIAKIDKIAVIVGFE